MVKNVLLFYCIGVVIVLCITLCYGAKRYFFEDGIDLSDIIEGVFFSLMSWSFLIVAIMVGVIGILEKMGI